MSDIIKQYDDNSISALKDADRVRERVGVMLGSDDINGAWHTVIEIMGNAADEAQINPNMTITLTYHADGSVTVADEGRGVPLGYNEKEQDWNWRLIYAELYAGGKYDDDSYNYSIGLNGVGAAAAQYTSEFFEVTSYREGKRFYKAFCDGKATEEPLEVTELEEERTGTVVHWKPDRRCFTDIAFTREMFEGYCRDQSCQLGIKIIFRDEHTTPEEPTETVYDGTSGLQGLLEDTYGDIVDKSFAVEKEVDGFTTTPKNPNAPYKAKVNFIFAFLEKEALNKARFFHNTGVMSEGVHYTALSEALANHVRSVVNNKDLKVQSYDYMPYVGIVCSTYSTITSFSNQTKTGVNNDFIKELVYTSIKRLLDELAAKKDEAYLAFVERIMQAAQQRKQLEEYRKMLKSAKKTVTKKLPEKLADCRSRDVKHNELYIVEGDSAMGACKLARDASFQAVIPIRGKILNCQKASLNKILASECIRDLAAAVGCGLDIGGSAAKADGEDGMFDIKKLRYGKIIFCTDADVDAYQIRVLLYILFYTLMPELVEKGYVYIAETPLFEFETNKGSMFAYDWQERDAIMAKCKEKGIKIKRINRSKGLGENDPEMMSVTTMNPKTRRLISLKTDTKMREVQVIVDMLFGKDINNLRRDYILELIQEGLSESANENVNVLDTATV